MFIWGGFAFLILFGLLFLVRDSLKYLDWSEAVYRRFWPQRVGLALHAPGSSLSTSLASEDSGSLRASLAASAPQIEAPRHRGRPR